MNRKQYLVFKISWGSSRLIGSLRIAKDNSLPSLVYYILEEFLHMLYPFTFLFWDDLYIWVFALLSCECLVCTEKIRKIKVMIERVLTQDLVSLFVGTFIFGDIEYHEFEILPIHPRGLHPLRDFHSFLEILSTKPIYARKEPK